MNPRGSQNGSRRLQNAARNAENGFPRVPNHTLTSQNCSKSMQDEKKSPKVVRVNWWQPILKVFGLFLGSILDPFWVKNRVKNRTSFRGRFLDLSKLIFCKHLLSPTLDLKRLYCEFDGFPSLQKIASESDFGLIFG